MEKYTQVTYHCTRIHGRLWISTMLIRSYHSVARSSWSHTILSPSSSRLSIVWGHSLIGSVIHTTPRWDTSWHLTSQKNAPISKQEKTFDQELVSKSLKKRREQEKLRSIDIGSNRAPTFETLSNNC